jgi:hypothetical protein
LEGTICTLCCGENRGGKINCPESCSYFISHEEYQKERVGEQFLNQRKFLMRKAFKKGGEKALIFLNLIDMFTYAEFHKHPDTPPSAVLEGMEFVRQQLSPLTVQSQFTSTFGGKLFKEVENILKEADYRKDFMAEMIEGNIEFIKSFSEETSKVHSFLKALIGYIETFFPDEAKKMREKEDTNKIIAPGALNISKDV